MCKTLLVLGASSECGIEIIKDIIDKYDLIYAHYGHNSARLELLKNEFGKKIILIKDDFSIDKSGEKVLSVIEEKGIWPEHIIVLPSAKYQTVKFAKTPLDSYKEGLQIGLFSVITVLQKVIAKMIKDKKKGRIIFMLSLVVSDMPPKYTAPYTVSKYALLGLMKELSVEYADKGIMVNAISPGMMETQLLSEISEVFVKQNAEASPFGRNIKVSEVVPTVEYLLSDGAERITGQNIVISGGM